MKIETEILMVFTETDSNSPGILCKFGWWMWWKGHVGDRGDRKRPLQVGKCGLRFIQSLPGLRAFVFLPSQNQLKRESPMHMRRLLREKSTLWVVTGRFANESFRRRPVHKIWVRIWSVTRCEIWIRIPCPIVEPKSTIEAEAEKNLYSRL